ASLKGKYMQSKMLLTEHVFSNLDAQIHPPDIRLAKMEYDALQQLRNPIVTVKNTCIKLNSKGPVQFMSAEEKEVPKF
ncbi:MAG: hypothetical protein QXL15_04075, partial [Candidatus Korarchaeota archaeon]